MQSELSFDVVLKAKNNVMPDAIELSFGGLHLFYNTRVDMGIEMPTLNVTHISSF